MTERMGLVTAGRQDGRSAALARRAELRPAARRLAAVAVGFAGGWAVLYGALMPFGLGFVLGFAEDCFAPCAAGAAMGMLLHGFGALSLRSVCMLCALGAAVAARWMGTRKLAPAALAGCGTLVGMALCFAFGGEGTELVLYSAADALLAAAIGFCLRQFAPEKPGAGMLLVGALPARHWNCTCAVRRRSRRPLPPARCWGRPCALQTLPSALRRRALPVPRRQQPCWHPGGGWKRPRPMQAAA